MCNRVDGVFHRVYVSLSDSLTCGTNDHSPKDVTQSLTGPIRDAREGTVQTVKYFGFSFVFCVPPFSIMFWISVCKYSKRVTFSSDFISGH